MDLNNNNNQTPLARCPVGYDTGHANPSLDDNPGNNRKTIARNLPYLKATLNRDVQRKKEPDSWSPETQSVIVRSRR